MAPILFQEPPLLVLLLKLKTKITHLLLHPKQQPLWTTGLVKQVCKQVKQPLCTSFTSRDSLATHVPFKKRQGSSVH